MRSWNEQARHQSPDHFSSYWALHLDRALQRTEGIVSMNDFARKPARQQAVRLNPLSAFIRRVCYMLAQKEALHEHDVCLVLTVSMLTGGNQDVLLGVYDTENDCKAAAEEQHVKAECYPLKGLLDEHPAGFTVQM